MTAWQVFTFTTLGFCIALGTVSVAFATFLYFDSEGFDFVWAMFSTEMPPQERFIPLAILAFAGCWAAGSLFKAQQWLAARSADRAIARIERQYREILKSSGPEAANAWFIEFHRELVNRAGPLL